MKRLFKISVIVVLISGSTICLTSCRKETTPPVVITINVSEITQTTALTGGTVADDGGAAVTKEGVCWSISEFPTINDTKTTDGAAGDSFTSNLAGLHPGTTYFVRAYAGNSTGVGYGNRISFTTQGSGARKNDYPGGAIYGATGFAIGTKIYMGLGYNEDGEFLGKNFWEYDQATNLWTRKADFEGSAQDAVGFSIGNKGYIGTGWNGVSNTKDFWEYDQATNEWTKKADFGGISRSGAVGFSIGTKGYIGTGWNDDSNLKDFWEYDQKTNVWTKKADFGGAARSRAVGFSIGTNGYIGTGLAGWDGDSDLKDFWEYDQATNLWTQKTDFGGTARNGAVGFSIGTKGYIGTGNNSKDFWEYDQANNMWTRRVDFEGSARGSAVGFSIGNKGYIGTGFSSGTYTYFAFYDFWEYDPTLQ
jgi:hypothetical protein